jgi:glycogen(starch) synthase
VSDGHSCRLVTEMRVLTLIHLYPPHHVGGYEVACQGAMEYFAERGDEVLVLTNDYRLHEAEEPPSTVQVRRDLRGWWDWEAFAPEQVPVRDRIRRERHNQSVLRRVLQDFDPDVASVWDLAFMSWSLATMVERRHVPIVLTFLDQWIATSADFDAWTRIFARRSWAHPLGRALGLETRLPTFDGSTASVASKMIGDTISSESRWKFPGAELVPLGVDTSDFPVSSPREEPWSWKILYVGRVVPHKGVLTLVRALALLPDEARLDIVGHVHESQRRNVMALAAELGFSHRVEMDEARSRQDLRRRYQQADVLVFPSEYPEPFGIVPLEAMACGTPVVASGTGGSGEFLADGVNCVLFTPGEPEELAAAVRRVANDRELRHQIVTGGTATASELTLERFSARLYELHGRAARTRL